VRLVLLPGMDGTGWLFESLVQALPPAIEPLVLDLPADRALGYDALLPLLRARVPDEPCVVLGESFSGPLAIRLAAELPHVRGLILCASFARSPAPRALVSLGALFAAAGPPPATAIRALLAGLDAPADLVHAVRRAIASVAPGVMPARLRAVAQVDVTSTLAQVQRPVLYLQATRDRLVGPSAVQHVRQACPHARIVPFDSPHLVAQRRPTRVAQAIASFTLRTARSP